MHEKHVRLFPVVPPGLDVAQVGPMGIAFGFPFKPALVDPHSPQHANVVRTGHQRRSDPTWRIVHFGDNFRRVG